MGSRQGDWSEQLFHRFWGPLVRSISLRSDDGVQTRRKWILVPFWCIGCVFSSLATLSLVIVDLAFGKFEYHPVMIVANTSEGTACAYFLWQALKRKRISDFTVKSTILSGTIAIIVFDLMTGGTFHMWTLGFFLIVMHNCVLGPKDLAEGAVDCGLGWLLKVVLHTWLLMVLLEDALDFGLFSTFATSPAFEVRKARGFHIGVWAFVCNVASVSLTSMFGRQAARNMFEEQQKQEAAVDLARSIAQALVRFDLAAAEKLVSPESTQQIDCATGRPVQQGPDMDVLASVPELADAFRGLLKNLRRYRPFLPDALFVASESNTEGATHVDLDMEALNSAPGHASAAGSGTDSSKSSSPRSLGLGLSRRAVAVLCGQVQFGAEESMLGAMEHGGTFVSAMFSCVRTSGGLVQNFDASGVFVTFGARNEMRDDVGRACSCALAMKDALHGLFSHVDALSATAGISVTYGECVVGSVGDEDKRAFQVVGRCTDLARALAPLGPVALGGLGVLCDRATAGRAEQQGVKASRIHMPLERFGFQWATGGRWDGVELFQVTFNERCQAALLHRQRQELEQLPEHLRVDTDALIAPQQLEAVGRAAHGGWVEIAKGQFGRVFAAHLRTLGDDVAVKELKSCTAAADDIDSLTKKVAFLKEMNNLHETPVNQVLRYYGWAQGPQGQLFMVTELCGKGALPRWLGGLSSETRGVMAVHVAVSVGRAVAYIHSVGKVHMDIAARNVLVTYTGELRLGDLGLLSKEGEPAQIIAVCWSPPESVAARAAARKAAKPHDLWSFGCLLLEVLTGARPWAHVSSDRVRGGSLMRAVAERLRDGELPHSTATPPRSTVEDSRCNIVWNSMVLPLWTVREARPAMREIVDVGSRLWRSLGTVDLPSLFSGSAGLERMRMRQKVDAVLSRRRERGLTRASRSPSGQGMASHVSGPPVAAIQIEEELQQVPSLLMAPEGDTDHPETSDYADGGDYFVLRDQRGS
eukprot:TRINITY_DN1871_c0_g1_i3.p1 TRINITY_DN1871_c0_g1~~TRINITY_DN1871_c0_g1_i3.p1  ORF type:complete len:983 (+),score=204.97 TRINITY_DN1871_c0_g1_i3:70-3018(+)